MKFVEIQIITSSYLFSWNNQMKFVEIQIITNSYLFSWHILYMKTPSMSAIIEKVNRHINNNFLFIQHGSTMLIVIHITGITWYQYHQLTVFFPMAWHYVKLIECIGLLVRCDFLLIGC